MAGKQVKCPACAHVWRVPGGGVLDAETVPDTSAGSNWFDEGMSDTYRLATPSGQASAGQSSGAPAAGPEPPRRPCPMCGEMIVLGAAKCRYCDAVFDENLRRTEKKKRRGGYSSDDENPSTLEWVLCVICPGPVCIASLIYLIMGKPKALKLLGGSLLVVVIEYIILVIIGVSVQQRSPLPPNFPQAPPGINQPQPGLPPGFPQVPPGNRPQPVVPPLPPRPFR
jgi:hypothetical protein